MGRKDRLEGYSKSQRRAGAAFLAQLPAGTEIVTYAGRMYFAHADHPVRCIDENGMLAPVPLAVANAVRERAENEKLDSPTDAELDKP